MSVARGHARFLRRPARIVVASIALAASALGVEAATASSSGAAAKTVPSWAQPNVGDYAGGHAWWILPPGENGLVNAEEAAQFEATGARPAGSQDQLAKYANLIFGYKGLTNSGLYRFYDSESLNLSPSQIVRTEHPSSTVPVVIYRDSHDVPHIYGANVNAMAFGAGYAAAEDRLFLMDVLRHYGEGTLSAFLGPSCAFEQMDHDELLAAPYTTAQANAQIAAIPHEYGKLGQEAVGMLKAYVNGINAYISAAQSDPSLMPADYAAALEPPQPWAPADIIYIAALIGGIFGKGGGAELQNARLVQYLDKRYGQQKATTIFTDFKEQNDPAAPTTIVGERFPYEIPGRIDPSRTAMPDNAAAPLKGGPTDTTSNCSLSAPNPTALSIISALQALPKQISNALVVSAKDSATGHPIAVFGPQVSYYAPQILMEEQLHAPDFSAEGASFPGTNFIVELGRGPDFAWSATSAGSDNVDQRLELICNPKKGQKPAAEGTDYEFRGHCLPMVHETFSETAVPKPGGTGGPTTINHQIYLTRHGIVQGWTTADGGKPVAVVVQRSTYNHEADSAIGFLRWNTPSLTHSPQSWMVGAADIGYTFNWFYLDDKNIAYYQSGWDPIRPSDVNPNLPTWGTGDAEWQGMLSANAHPHQVNPPSGFFTSWNNKPAPGFSAADDNYAYGPIYRVLSLDDAIKQQLRLHHGKITQANLVTAMEQGGLTDLDGAQELPLLLRFLGHEHFSAGVSAMLGQLRSWEASGSLRVQASPGATQYEHAAAVAIMDELQPILIRALFDGIFAKGGVTTYDGMSSAYRVVPMEFVNTPDGDGAHLGSAYDGGWESDVVKVLQELDGMRVPQPFSPVTAHLICRHGLSSCRAAIATALVKTYSELVTANGDSKVASWSESTATKAAGLTMPAYDAIHFSAVGIIGQPDIEWQNRSTFQQVEEFTGHRSSN